MQSINRAFQLLHQIANRPGGISDLAERTGLPISTVARLLKTLHDLDAVARDPDGRYAVGPALANLTTRAALANQIEALDQAQLESLATQLGEIVGLSVPAGDDVLYVVQADSANEIQVRDWTGERIPLHVVSSGLIFLAHSEPSAIDRYLQSTLRTFTPATITEPDRIRARLDQVRQQGHVWTNEEFHTGINSIAAPIYNNQGKVVAALHSHGPSYRFPTTGSEERIADHVAYLAARLSHTPEQRVEPSHNSTSA